ncbi:hypothetical protein MGYG_05858 [Nannizzia gypsea CBS 118893]|uniref:Ecp2 effector protein domain-containing protein n=1 Tax=Arthroderma gypseum (strain ATCC MYA-4604 / CBS 118893) TaxID=535722 RepID=E4UZS0_ARTGP|nr:hypothetical protein MGYG_05858 [Nannizzia gypsea CBS 118893]EFR02857.1 hypothetical protein MGYG_05858 [Nannizzia gypsea CBS 118893]
MKVLALFSLASVAAGVTIRNHFEDNCRGGYLDFPNIPPKVCAVAISGNVRGAVTVAYSQVPLYSPIYGWQARDGYTCGTIVKGDIIGSGDSKCLAKLAGTALYSGSSWSQPGLLNVKGGKDVACTGKMAPHSIVLNDGHKYSLNSMDNEMFKTLYRMAVKGATSQELPIEYAAFEIEMETVQQRAQEIQD